MNFMPLKVEVLTFAFEYVYWIYYPEGGSINGHIMLIFIWVFCNEMNYAAL